MFIFDVETLGVESTTVVLSAALIHFDPEQNPSYQDMLDDSCFVKLSAKNQIERAKRTVSKDTLKWWDSQHEYTKKVSLVPSKDDLTPEEAFARMHAYKSKFANHENQTIWARGSLDQMAIDSLAHAFDLQPLAGYNLWRDVRTAVDILYGTSNGYCEVDHPTFKRHEVIKHHPIHDCALDAMMLMYGKRV